MTPILYALSPDRSVELLAAPSDPEAVSDTIREHLNSELVTLVPVPSPSGFNLWCVAGANGKRNMAAAAWTGTMSPVYGPMFIVGLTERDASPLTRSLTATPLNLRGLTEAELSWVADRYDRLYTPKVRNN